MFNTFAVLLATAVAANAASSSNPYIPSDISASCTTFLNTLNTDTSLIPCTSALTTASSGFGPGGNATSSSKDAVKAALTNLCSSTTASTCPQSLITSKLTAFYTACGPELTSAANAQVKIIYDTFYFLTPLRNAVCSTDTDGGYCALKATSSVAASQLAPALATTKTVSRRADTVTAYMPNAKTINDNNILFMFLDGSRPKDQLCTPCTRNIVSSYITFEANTNYAPGMLQSVLASGQTPIYQGVVNTCGADFLTAVKAAGGLGQNSGLGGSSGALSLRASAAGSMLAMLVGLAFVL